MTFVEALLASDGQQGKEKLLTDILDLEISFFKGNTFKNNFYLKLTRLSKNKKVPKHL